MAKLIVSNNQSLNYKSKDLQRFEPERVPSKLKKIVYGLVALAIIILVVLQIVLSKINEIGKEKS